MASLYVIDVPPKIWRPKPVNRYIPIDYGTDIDDGMFDYSHYGKTVFRPTIKWSGSQRTDIILFDKSADSKELYDNLNIGKNVSATNKSAIVDLIIKYWDCFCMVGARRTILDYEFAIDTGSSPPICCRRPKYGPHEKPIIMDQINSLLAND